MANKKIIKDYVDLPKEVLLLLKTAYPYGYAEHLVSFTDKNGAKTTALPFDTNEVSYLIRMTKQEAIIIMEDDEELDQPDQVDEQNYYDETIS